MCCSREYTENERDWFQPQNANSPLQAKVWFSPSWSYWAQFKPKQPISTLGFKHKCSWFCLLKQFEKKYGLVFVNYKFEKCSLTVKKTSFFLRIPFSIKFKQHFTNSKLYLKKKKKILFKINHWSFKVTPPKPSFWTVTPTKWFVLLSLSNDLIEKELKKWLKCKM